MLQCPHAATSQQDPKNSFTSKVNFKMQCGSTGSNCFSLHGIQHVKFSVVSSATFALSKFLHVVGAYCTWLSANVDALRLQSMLFFFFLPCVLEVLMHFRKHWSVFPVLNERNILVIFLTYFLTRGFNLWPRQRRPLLECAFRRWLGKVKCSRARKLSAVGVIPFHCLLLMNKAMQVDLVLTVC